MLVSTLVKFIPSSALRVAEFWSHVSVYDGVFAVGNGKAIRAAWAKIAGMDRARIATAARAGVASQEIRRSTFLAQIARS
jgi:hypothetical protein